MIIVPKKLPSLDLLREVLLDQERDLPLHAQLRTSLQRLIVDFFENNDRFYSETQLIASLKISQGTVRRALADLVNMGLLKRYTARGTLVRKVQDGVGLLNLAVFMPEWSSAYNNRVLQLLSLKCLERNVAMQTFYTHRGEHLLKAYGQLKFSPAEGGVVLLANSPQATTELSAALGDKAYRYVVVDTLIRDKQQNLVETSNREIIDTGMDYLMSKGHRRIVMLVNEPEDNENVRERVSAFEKYAATTPTLEVAIHHCGIHSWEDSAQATVKVMRDIWNLSSRPTAIFTTSDNGAVAVITWLQKNGTRVPQDVSVLGVDGLEIGGMIHPGLTSVAQPFEKMAETVFEILCDASPRLQQVFLTPYLVIRESVSVPPAS